MYTGGVLWKCVHWWSVVECVHWWSFVFVYMHAHAGGVL